MKYLCLYIAKFYIRLDIFETNKGIVSHYGKDVVRVPWYSEYSEELHIMWTANLSRIGDRFFESDLKRVFRVIDSLNTPGIKTVTYQVNANLWVTELRYKGYLHSVNDQPSFIIHYKDAGGSFDRQKHVSYRYYDMGVLKKDVNKTLTGYSIDYYVKDEEQIACRDPRNTTLVRSEYYEPSLRVVDWTKNFPTRYRFFDHWSKKVSKSGIYTLRVSPKENVLELVRENTVIEVRMPASLCRYIPEINRSELPHIITQAMRKDLLTIDQLTMDDVTFNCFKKYFKTYDSTTISECLNKIKTRIQRPFISN